MCDKRTACQHPQFYEICTNGVWVCSWCQNDEIERLRAALSGAYTVLAVVLDDIKEAARAAGGEYE